MSKPCPVPECGRSILDKREACEPHWARISMFTKERIATAGTDVAHDSAWHQALIEINDPRKYL